MSPDKKPALLETPSGRSTAAKSRVRRAVVRFAKWSLTLAVLVFVARRAVELWQTGSAGEVELHAGWLTLAGVLYTAAWLPSTWYWRSLALRMGDRLPWRASIRAYYCGQLGKYVPGKALVPIIRGQMAASAGGRFRVGVLAAVYETLLMMATGAALSVALLPELVPEDVSRLPQVLQHFFEHPASRWLLAHPLVLAMAVCASTAATAPVIGRIFAVVTRKLVDVPEAESLTRRIDARTICEGGITLAAAWLMLGLALWAVLRGVGTTASIGAVPAWTACASLAIVGGFFAVFAPGGVGVREGLMIELLQFQPGVDARQAIAAAFLMRFVGLVAEVAAAAVVYYGLAERRAEPRTESREDAGGPPSSH